MMLTENDNVAVIKTFLADSAGGLDGLRAQHLITSISYRVIRVHHVVPSHILVHHLILSMEQNVNVKSQRHDQSIYMHR